MGKLWGQFWCIHHWHKVVPVDISWGKGFKYRYHCTVCDKVIYRWSSDEPISGIIPDAWAEYKKDPLNSVSPPIYKD